MVQNKIDVSQNHRVELINHNKDEMRNLVNEIQKDHSEALESKLKEIIDLRNQLQSAAYKLSKLEGDKDQNSNSIS